MAKIKMIRKFLVPSDPWVDSYAKVVIEKGSCEPLVSYTWQDDISVAISDCDRKVTLDFGFTRGDRKQISTQLKKMDKLFEILEAAHNHLFEADASCEEDFVGYNEAKLKRDETRKSREYL